MSFPHADYYAAVHAARTDSQLDVEADILDFKEDEKKKGMLFLKLRFRARVDTTDFADGGTAVQRDETGGVTFLSDIVTLDESTGEVVIEVHGKSPTPKPDPDKGLVLNPPDFLRILDEYAAGMIIKPSDNPETRFMQLAEVLCQKSQGKPSGVKRADLRQSQNDAVEAALHNQFSFIWGPPGTGKSYTLGHLAAEWRKAGKKVLVVAHTNTAVDVATFAIDNACTARGENLSEAELIRYTSRITNISEYRKRPHLLAFTRLLEELQKAETSLRTRRALLQNELARLADKEAGRESLALEIAKLELELGSLGGRRKAEVQKLLEGASIVCVSITSCLFGHLLERFRFDAVMLDEASLVPLAVWPWLLHSWHGDSGPQFAVAGDPMQLQPIFKRRNIPNAEYGAVSCWFERNIYAYLGIDSMDSAGALMKAGTLVFLREQFRMASGIREAVSRTFYGGLLVGDGTDILPPWQGESGIPNGHVVAIDPARCAPLPAAKRVRNVLGLHTNAAAMDVTLLLVRRMINHMLMQSGRDLSVFVVTPFRNQSREYEKRLAALAKPKNVTLGASTIHRCQGREADVVIFDLVDAESQFVRRPEAASLWCVACSRAKSQLFLVGDEAAMRNGRFSQMMVNGLPFIGLV